MRQIWIYLPALLGVLLHVGAAAVTQAAEPKVLFIRGADRSGGFLEARSDKDRTEQLADINNASTSSKNHGWKQLADLLRADGFEVSQIAEAVESDAAATGPTRGVAVPLESMNLSQYKVIVFGSNNAKYGTRAIDAVVGYLNAGGGAIFISDANFGSDWADASDSDQPFLNRLGLVANQDHGTYARYRGDNHFVVPDHPIFKDVNAFDGEGVTPVTVKEVLAGVKVEILAPAGGQVRRNEPPFGKQKQGRTSPATEQDAALAVGTAGKGRFAWHFDRNTFFNDNGAGTSLERKTGNTPLDNRRYALNLFRWTAGLPTDRAVAE